jgi:YfiH family protein
VKMIFAQWPAPAHVVAGTTLRSDGVSRAPYAMANLALHVGDDPSSVVQNRQKLDQTLPGKKEWQWLNQVHGVEVAAAPVDGAPDADAVVANRPGVVCTVLTADCLPILLCNREGTEVAAIHAGWRSLCYGVVEKSVAAMKSSPETLLAWMGPAIGPQAFEVGSDVREAFLACDPTGASSTAFEPTGAAGKYLANLYLLASIRLQQCGVNAIHGGGLCTYTQERDFYSFRRDGVTGRMATFIYFHE